MDKTSLSTMVKDDLVKIILKLDQVIKTVKTHIEKMR